MRSLFVSVVMMSLLGVATSLFVLRFGKCPQPPVVKDFDVTRYIGKWWEYQRFPAPFEYGVKCGFANYTLLSDTKVKVVNAGIQEIKFYFFGIEVVLSTKPIISEGEAVILNPAEPSKLRVTFSDSMPGNDGKPNYLVVDTDYENFSLVYSCSEIGLLNVQLAWILTRAQGVKPSNLQQLHDVLSASGVDLRPFITADQRNCS